MLYNIILLFIKLIHLLIIAFVLAGPLQKDIMILFIHNIFLPLIMLHWHLNNDTCAITIIESQIRKKLNPTSTKDECISHQIISPIYNFLNLNIQYKTLIWGIIIILWLFGLYKTYQRFDEFKILLNNLLRIINHIIQLLK